MLKWLNKKRNKKGFTLVELVVVIAILGILAGIAVPRLSGFRKNAAIAADKATAATIAKAAELYNATAKKADKFEKNDESEDMINQLIESDLIDGNLVVQQEGKDDFVLKYEEISDENKNMIFRVYYGAEGDLIYPEKEIEPETP